LLPVSGDRRLRRLRDRKHLPELRSDATLKRLRRNHLYLLGALALTFVLFNVPYGGYVLYPFKLFATWLHETGHGTMALLTGGSFDRMVIRADTSGTAYHTSSAGIVARALVSSAGYMGTSFFGALLLLAGTASERRARLALGVVGAAMLLVDLVFVRNLFGLVAIGVLGAALTLVARRAPASLASALLNLLASQSCCNALLDIRTLFTVGTAVVPGQGRSDAAAMQDLLFIPYWFWAGLWMVLSVAILTVTLWFVWRRERRQAPSTRPARAC
jgi:peptidase M50B-like protein